MNFPGTLLREIFSELQIRARIPLYRAKDEASKFPNKIRLLEARSVRIINAFRRKPTWNETKIEFIGFGC